MTERYAQLRGALAAVPCAKWSASRSSVTIPKVDDWAEAMVFIGGLDKSVSRPYARYIADVSPHTIRALLADYDALNVQLRIERAKSERIFRVLMGIHALLFPPIVKSGDIAYQFSPKDAVEWTQRISDRIRSIPDDLAALAQEQGENDD